MATYMWTALERRTGKIRLHRLTCRFIRIGQEPVFRARTKYSADPIPARYPLEDPAVATDFVSPTSLESRNPSALYVSDGLQGTRLRQIHTRDRRKDACGSAGNQQLLYATQDRSRHR